jgi:hypothetical protein
LDYLQKAKSSKIVGFQLLIDIVSEIFFFSGVFIEYLYKTNNCQLYV